jgi:hypothetical protein
MSRYADDLRFQIERSPFSEEIVFAGNPGDSVLDGENTIEFVTVAGGKGFEYTLLENGVAVRGLFDESAERDEASRATRRKPRVTVFGCPLWVRTGTHVLVRGKQFAVTSYEADANLGIVVWLR